MVEYHGDLLEIKDAKKREEEYGLNPATGCYMYYFQYLNKTYWYVLTRLCVLCFCFVPTIIAVKQSLPKYLQGVSQRYEGTIRWMSKRP